MGIQIKKHISITITIDGGDVQTLSHVCGLASRALDRNGYCVADHSPKNDHGVAGFSAGETGLMAALMSGVGSEPFVNDRPALSEAQRGDAPYRKAGRGENAGVVRPQRY